MFWKLPTDSSMLVSISWTIFHEVVDSNQVGLIDRRCLESDSAAKKWARRIGDDNPAGDERNERTSPGSGNLQALQLGPKPSFFSRSGFSLSYCFR